MNVTKLKRLLAIFVSHLPMNALRVFGYRVLFQYKIGDRVRLGFGAVLAVRELDCEDGVTVGRGTSFIGPISVKLGRDAFVGRFNRIECGEVAGSASKAHMQYALRFEMGANSLIHEDHLFDVYGLVSIGEGTWVAGFGSQFLTHGASARDRDIRIGRKCYIGSAVRFSPGACIGDQTIVGMGAVVTKKFEQDNVVLGGVPAKVIKTRAPDDGYVFEKNW